MKAFFGATTHGYVPGLCDGFVKGYTQLIHKIGCKEIAELGFEFRQMKASTFGGQSFLLQKGDEEIGEAILMPGKCVADPIVVAV